MCRFVFYEAEVYTVSTADDATLLAPKDMRFCSGMAALSSQRQAINTCRTTIKTYNRPMACAPGFKSCPLSDMHKLLTEAPLFPFARQKLRKGIFGKV